MKAFTHLIHQLDYASEDSDKVNAFVHFLQNSSDQDKLWAISILSGKRKPRVLTIDKLVEWSLEISGISPWLFDQSQEVVKDKVETVSLILGNAQEEPESTELSFWLGNMEALRNEAEENQKEILKTLWLQLSSQERYVFNKLLVGSFRLTLDDTILIKAISAFTNNPVFSTAISFYMKWDPGKNHFDDIFRNIHPHIYDWQPAPFGNINPTNEVPDMDHWGNCLIRRLKPGVRVQLIIKGKEWFLWGKDERYLSPFFPEMDQIFLSLDEDLALEGYITESNPENQIIEKRLKKSFPTKTFIQKNPVAFNVFDLWEWEGENWRIKSPLERYQKLQEIISQIDFPEWISLIPPEDIQSQVEFHAIHGAMHKSGISLISLIKEKNGFEAFFLNPPPISIAAVLIYVHRNNRGPGFSHISLGIYKGEELVPIAKLPFPFTGEEALEVEEFIKKNTREKFGPVRNLKPEWVFELEAESVSVSPRHKAGLLFREVRLIKKSGSVYEIEISRVEDFI